MLPSKMLNLFSWALALQCPEIILDTVVISFLSALLSSNHGLRETLEITLERVKITFMRVEITLVRVKITLMGVI
jgi:hypothetical protein